uniref:Solute carrier family 12 member 9 n=1 Tax=Macrostomum lignano TaxID=282301 RepID=A0A1I8HU05_9PLAT
MLTILSISAISSNGEIQVMISRTLGPEFGGAMGLLFFIANIFSCGLYVSGFTEAFLDNFGSTGILGQWLPDGSAYWRYLYSFVVLTVCLGICLVGGSLFARTSAFILLILLVCYISVVVSLLFHPPFMVPIPHPNKYVYPGNDTNSTVYYNFTGPNLEMFLENSKSHYSPDYTIDDPSSMSFARVFAILFSSVTGIMNGANLSGELRKPSESIPRGTLLATLFTFLCYILLGLTIAASCQYELLINNYSFLIPINYWSGFVVIGLSAATLSAALGNLIGASRILYALAKDGLFGLPLKPAAVTVAGGNPIPAVAISFCLVMLVLLIGSLNLIAPIVTCFFLLAYASTNLACAALDLASAPNFRPTFKLFHWSASLAGLFGSLVMGFLVSYIYTPISIMIMLGLMIVLHLRSLPDNWGSISQALIFHQVRNTGGPNHFANLASSSNAQMIKFVNDLKKAGLYVWVTCSRRYFNLEQMVIDPSEEAMPEWLSIVDELKVKAFVELTVAPRCSSWCSAVDKNLRSGRNEAKHADQQSHEPGVINLSASPSQHHGWFSTSSSTRDVATPGDYTRLLGDVLQMGKELLVLRHMHALDSNGLGGRGKRQIDVWPVNFFQPGLKGYIDTTCLLQLQFACILNSSRRWRRDCRIRVFLCVDAGSNLDELTKQLDLLLGDLRIQAQTHILDWQHVVGEANPMSDGAISSAYLTAVNQCIRLQSPETAAAFLYLPRPPSDPRMHAQYLEQIDILTKDLPPTVLVHGLHKVFSRKL